MSMCLSASPSVCTVCLSAYQFACLTTCVLSVCLLSVYLPVFLFTFCLLVCLSVSVYLSYCLSISLTVCISLLLSVCLLEQLCVCPRQSQRYIFMPGSQRSTIIILKSSPARFATPASEQIRQDRRLWACKYTPGMAKKGDSQRELSSFQEAKPKGVGI
jgi:hypothetical protein